MTAKWTRRGLLAGGAASVAACAAPPSVEETTRNLAPLGNFKLGYVIVVADNAEIGPFSREATPDELEAALKPKLEALFSPYQGDHFYHIAVGVGAYALAQPGIPIIAAPKSALGVVANVWDDETQMKINEEPKEFLVLERLSGSSLLGSGLVMTKEEQLEALANQTVQQIYNWVVENAAWFEDGAPQTEG